MLTRAQLCEFGERGYLVVPRVVGEAWLSAADAEIDRVVATSPAAPDELAHQSLFLPPAELPAALAALTDSGALAVAEELTAPDHLGLILRHIQVARNTPPTVTARAGRTSTGTYGSGLVRSRPIHSLSWPASS